MRIATIDDYTNIPGAGPTPHLRHCPSLSTRFPGLTKTYNPLSASGPLVLRRWTFLAIQFFQFIHILFFTTAFSTSPSVLPATILSILFFLFTAWNLHLIVQMEGERVVFGRSWGRGSFDAFLGIMLVSSAALVGWDFWGWNKVAVAYSWHAGNLLAILGVAWVVTWEAEVLGLVGLV